MIRHFDTGIASFTGNSTPWDSCVKAKKMPEGEGLGRKEKQEELPAEFEQLDDSSRMFSAHTKIYQAGEGRKICIKQILFSIPW